MIPKERVRLLEVWRKELFEELSISEIMKISKKRTKPWVFNALKELTKNSLLIARRKANINLYRLNLDNPFVAQTLQYLEAERLFDFSRLDVIVKVIESTSIKGYCLLGFGGGICILVENKEDEKKIKSCLGGIKVCYINFDDFGDMLLRKEENIAKRIVKEHKLFFNADIYYQLIKEVYRKGYRR